MGQLRRAQEQIHRERPTQRTSLERALADSPALSVPPIQADDPAISGLAVGGAVDIGSNSVHLLVALCGPGWMEPLRDTSELLGLGDTVDRHGEIPVAERGRVVDVLRSYVETAHRSHAEHLTLLGTEPLRRARNAQVLIDEIADATGLRLRILTEREEAILTFIGVTRGQAPNTPLIVVDIGGGSTEVSLWNPANALHVDSIPIGSSRLTNATVEHDPPTEDELDRLFSAARDATAGLNSTALPAGSMTAARAIFVGGTATNVARIARLTREALAEDRRTLASLPFAAVSARYNVKPRRSRQLAAGVAIVDALLATYGLESADASEASLRDGAIIVAARFGDEWPESLEELVAG